eukprot:CAMPEP_0198285374 /NCGR_PEP_ID=MMETSP1449-20131203/4687_1 /TAXON_ID=420275 /ORGANISM="Attheya septentrionalis, Strain CCMP2084" /LENGTH=177 /DNA_ID=CAMNT_0043982781 /DNA_START=27 /DNA_END=560 /DNA_ORIENTATION=+
MAINRTMSRTRKVCLVVISLVLLPAVLALSPEQPVEKNSLRKLSDTENHPPPHHPSTSSSSSSSSGSSSSSSGTSASSGASASSASKPQALKQAVPAMALTVAAVAGALLAVKMFQKKTVVAVTPHSLEGSIGRRAALFDSHAGTVPAGVERPPRVLDLDSSEAVYNQVIDGGSAIV